MSAREANASHRHRSARSEGILRACALRPPPDRPSSELTERPRGRLQLKSSNHLFNEDDLARLGHFLIATASQVLSAKGEVTRLTPDWIERHIGPATKQKSARPRACSPTQGSQRKLTSTTKIPR